jgi:hypothetical protein
MVLGGGEGGGRLGGWRRRDNNLAPRGEREEGEVGIKSTKGGTGWQLTERVYDDSISVETEEGDGLRRPRLVGRVQ